MNTLTNYIENHECTDVIYLDFCKAFDSVPHLRLLNKLQAYGISGKLLTWIKCFLNNRRQRVRINGSYSDYCNVDSGIPQGSILGPILFIIFINDLPDNLLSHCKIFADDTKIFNASINHICLQNDLLSLLDWSRIWQLSFNVKK